jgi:hypothetical protein
MNQHTLDQPTLDLRTSDQHLLDEAADAPWCGSHWADLSTPAVATTADQDPADLLARPRTAEVPVARVDGAFRYAA